MQHTCNTRAHRPVVVEVAQLVGEPLHVVWLESRCVIDNVETGGRDCSLANRLAH